MAETTSSGMWIVDSAPLFVIVLLAAHISALLYWMYRLASDKQPPRKKMH